MCVQVDHDYCTRQSLLSDDVFRGIFQHMDLKERTRFERCCKRFATIIPEITTDADWFDHLSYDYIRPKPFKNDESIEFVDLSPIYMNTFMKSRGMKRLTSEYFDEFQWISFMNHKPKRKKFIYKLLARRPDFNELVIDVSNEWECGKGFPYQFAVEILYTMMEEKCHHVSSLIIYTTDWFMLYEYLLCILFVAPEVRDLTIILTDVEEVLENKKMNEIWEKISSEVSLCKLHFIWRKVAKFYGFEEALHELEDVRYAPPSPESLRQVISKNAFLSRVELIGDFELIDELTIAHRLTDFTYYDFFEGRTMDQMTWPLQLFLPEDKSTAAKQIFDRFFLMRGHALKQLHIHIVQSNILLMDPDIFHSLTLHASNLTSLSLCFHRKSSIQLHHVVKNMNYLKRLRFSMWTPISEFQLKTILSACPKIRYMEYAILYDPPDPDSEYSDDYSDSGSSECGSESSVSEGIPWDPPADVPDPGNGDQVIGEPLVVPMQLDGYLQVNDDPDAGQEQEEAAPADDDHEEENEVNQIAIKELVWQEAVQEDAIVDLVSESSGSGSPEIIDPDEGMMNDMMNVSAGVSYPHMESEDLMTMEECYDNNQSVFENEIEVVSRTPEYLFPDNYADPLATMGEVMTDVGLDHEERYMRKQITPWRAYARQHLKRKIRVIVTATRTVPENIANINILKQVLHEIIDFKEYNLSVTFCNPK